MNTDFVNIDLDHAYAILNHFSKKDQMPEIIRFRKELDAIGNNEKFFNIIYEQAFGYNNVSDEEDKKRIFTNAVILSSFWYEYEDFSGVYRQNGGNALRLFHFFHEYIPILCKKLKSENLNEILYFSNNLFYDAIEDDHIFSDQDFLEISSLQYSLLNILISRQTGNWNILPFVHTQTQISIMNDHDRDLSFLMNSSPYQSMVCYRSIMQYFWHQLMHIISHLVVNESNVREKKVDYIIEKLLNDEDFTLGVRTFFSAHFNNYKDAKIKTLRSYKINLDFQGQEDLTYEINLKKKPTFVNYLLIIFEDLKMNDQVHYFNQDNYLLEDVDRNNNHLLKTILMKSFNRHK